MLFVTVSPVHDMAKNESDYTAKAFSAPSLAERKSLQLVGRTFRLHRPQWVLLNLIRLLREKYMKIAAQRPEYKNMCLRVCSSMYICRARITEKAVKV